MHVAVFQEYMIFFGIERLAFDFTFSLISVYC
jgi:hypothetical protein